MKNHSWSLAAAFIVTVLSVLYALPWQLWGYSIPLAHDQRGAVSFDLLGAPYKLGLDLHGGVELDYKVDFDAISGRSDFSESAVLDSLKRIVESRVNSLGTAEPTIYTATYGKEKHIIVQIPTQAVDPKLTADQRAAKNREFIQKAKDTVGKVVRLEFKEEKTQVTDADRAERRAIADAFAAEAASSADPFSTVALKYQDQHENVRFEEGTGTYAQIPAYAKLPQGAKPTAAVAVSPVFASAKDSYAYRDDQLVPLKEDGYSVVRLSAATGADLSATGTVWDYEVLFVSAKPSAWTQAKSADGKVLDEKYLSRAISGYSQSQYRYEIELQFNDEGARIFGDITKRLVGKPLAIFVGGQELTAPIIQQPIIGGKAQITGNYDKDSAAKLANDINTGIVPAPIYLTKEEAIDSKLGASAFHELLIAGVIGFLAILVFLVAVYRVSGFISALSLLAYLALTLAVVKATGLVVLTLSAIAGIILSLGIAIDANILMLERAKDELRAKHPLTKALRLGLDRSWSAIWDSNLTGLIVALILWRFGVSMIQSFGTMLALGIVTSLVVIRYVAYPITLALAGKFENRIKAYINFRG